MAELESARSENVKVESGAAKLSPVSLGKTNKQTRKHSRAHSHTHPERGLSLDFSLHWKYFTFNCFFFFLSFFPSRLCSPCQELSGEPRWEESGASLVFNDTTWRSNLLYGIVVALF